MWQSWSMTSQKNWTSASRRDFRAVRVPWPLEEGRRVQLEVALWASWASGQNGTVLTPNKMRTWSATLSQVTVTYILDCLVCVCVCVYIYIYIYIYIYTHTHTHTHIYTHTYTHTAGGRHLKGSNVGTSTDLAFQGEMHSSCKEELGC